MLHENEVGPVWITSLLLNIVTVSLCSNVPPSNKNIHLFLVKLC